MSPRSLSSEVPSKNVWQTQTKYKGLFTPQTAPTSRAYCILFSFFLGVVMITMGSVFYHVILSRPMSGTHPIHTPPLPLASGLISMGILMVLCSVAVTWRFGLDDGDDSLEEDSSYAFAKDDVLDQHHQCSRHNPPPV
ncbi:uncharacterized protein LOC135221924 [Macrobrachium nipponense]|uniref:uncharacterized protein LOC135221924 n=1 Tax=Macrobrachium nipponense TaxID=159736 RepID=UPI0030C889F6